jgi:hypothetical protein
MSPEWVSLATFVSTSVGSLLGIWMASRLPEHHLDESSRDTVKTGIGLIATMTALVLGLVTASAKSSFDDAETAVKLLAVDVLTLDRALARYGPESAPIRQALRHAVETRIEAIWPRGRAKPASPDPVAAGTTSETEQITEALRELQPRDEVHRAIKARALELSEAMLRSRWLVYLSSESSSVPAPFLVILVFWLTVIFASFGLLAPRNGTVLVVLGLCAVTVSSAIFLILELDAPFRGVVKVSPESMYYVEARLGR